MANDNSFEDRKMHPLHKQKWLGGGVGVSQN